MSISIYPSVNDTTIISILEKLTTSNESNKQLTISTLTEMKKTNLYLESISDEDITDGDVGE